MLLFKQIVKLMLNSNLVMMVFPYQHQLHTSDELGKFHKMFQNQRE